ncbi:hypothetical protein [Actinomadura opuntiae]|uniref:hypothetical protein n=1 Tax=Actinomadura sp. OS1-43 TaxID=604315 RepID=UPI00255B376E|nr:hypothetical protein [Actinomadura sp. OS1-43]MDL4815973.1 hypothetical protein [Actinomadura sp. OS1-43]
MTSEERRRATDREVHEQVVAQVLARLRSGTPGPSDGFRRKANAYHERRGDRLSPTS